MDILLIVIFALLGAAIGSFLNVCADRLPAGGSLLWPPSHCDACQRRLSFGDLIPVFSYLWLRRRCRYCHKPIPKRSFWLEVSCGLLFALLYWHLGLTAGLAVVIFYSCVFIVILVIDLEHHLILNKIVYPTALAALIINIFLPHPGFLTGIIDGPAAGVADCILGGAIGFIFLLIPAIISPRGMGLGDVKMAGLIGLVLGSGLVFVALLSGIIIGGLVAIFLLLFRIKGRKEGIPFGPFLSLTTIGTLLWGNHILNWYLGLF